MRYIKLTALVEPEDDGFVTICPELGTASCGDTVKEALDNLREAIEVHLNGLEEVGTTARVFNERGIEVFERPDEPSAWQRVIESCSTVEVFRESHSEAYEQAMRWESAVR